MTIKVTPLFHYIWYAEQCYRTASIALPSLIFFDRTQPLADIISFDDFPLKQDISFWKSCQRELNRTQLKNTSLASDHALKQRLLDVTQRHLRALASLECVWLADAYDFASKEAKDPLATDTNYVGRDMVVSPGDCSVMCSDCDAETLFAAIDLPNSCQSLNPIAFYFIVLVMFLKVFGKVSHAWTNSLLVGISIGCQLLSHMTSNLPLQACSFIAGICKDIPKDIRTAQKSLQLNPPSSVVYAACPNPKCSKIYSPSSMNTYPETCNPHISDVDGVCHEKLTRPASDGQGLRPIRPYTYFDVKARITEMAAWEPSASKLYKGDFGDFTGDQMHDILQGRLAREFPGPIQGPGGTTYFFDTPEEESRYLLTLSVDWMNPYGKKAAGISASVGVISLACINLPMSIRYKPENLILVGIIPGPHEPSLESVNHFLMPLVNDLLQLWNPGLTLPSRHGSSTNRVIRAAVLAFVADLPASRKIAGNAGHSADAFCSLCRLKRSSMNDLNVQSWPKHDCATHRDLAFAWLRASAAERQAIYKEHGIRWSPLFLLPYWDPTKQVVVDMMHDMFLGVVKRHFVDVLGMSDTPAATRDHHTTIQPDDAKLKKARLLLNSRETGSVERKLLQHRWAELYILCLETGVPLLEKRTNVHKKDMASKLEKWVRSLGSALASTFDFSSYLPSSGPVIRLGCSM